MKERCCQGYTIYSSAQPSQGGTPLIDMNGEIVHRWSIGGGPPIMIPGGSILARRDAGELVQEGWDGSSRMVLLQLG